MLIFLNMKLWLKVTFFFFWLFLLWGWVLYWLNTYEHKNNCTFSFPFLSCKVQYIPLFDNKIKKPLILLYPEKSMDVSVRISYAPWFFATFPEYDEKEKGWQVTAYPDGNLLDKKSGQETYGLFWEWNPGLNHFDISRWFVVKWSEIRNFLYTKLTEIGLNTKEKSDFIMFWYPKIQYYPYVQITFAGSDYTDGAKLNISPKPDSLLRVFMVAKPLLEYKELPKQTFEVFLRKGFSVVEWGGTIIE